jgi:hypothetical protein
MTRAACETYGFELSGGQRRVRDHLSSYGRGREQKLVVAAEDTKLICTYIGAEYAYCIRVLGYTRLDDGMVTSPKVQRTVDMFGSLSLLRYRPLSFAKSLQCQVLSRTTYESKV